MDELGAEAHVTLENGMVKKERPLKSYRHPELDSRLRTERTETEARLMEDARRHGVNVPEISSVDDNSIMMDRIEGEKLRDNLEIQSFQSLGRNIAYLHETDIIHGDLTSSNVIVGKEVYIIDFGLSFRSQRIEDRAVDIHLLKQVLESSHPQKADEMWESFLKGYREYRRYEEVMERLEEVEERGRYK